MITPERELTRKPLRMDFLILWLEEGCHMKSSLGKLLKKHTIVEYKGATDHLSVEDLFKGQAYASLYVSSGTGDASPERQNTALPLKLLCLNRQNLGWPSLRKNCS